MNRLSGFFESEKKVDLFPEINDEKECLQQIEKLKERILKLSKSKNRSKS